MEVVERRSVAYIVRREIIKQLGGECERCRFNDCRALQIHHRHGDGYKDRAHYSGAAYYQLILRDLWTGNYGLLCANCHAITTHDRFEQGVKKFDLDDLSDGELSELIDERTDIS